MTELEKYKKQKNKERLDLINWIKSELSQARTQGKKLDQSSYGPVQVDKILFLERLLRKLQYTLKKERE